MKSEPEALDERPSAPAVRRAFAEEIAEAEVDFVLVHRQAGPWTVGTVGKETLIELNLKLGIRSIRTIITS